MRRADEVIATDEEDLVARVHELTGEPSASSCQLERLSNILKFLLGVFSAVPSRSVVMTSHACRRRRGVCSAGCCSGARFSAGAVLRAQGRLRNLLWHPQQQPDHAGYHAPAQGCRCPAKSSYIAHSRCQGRLACYAMASSEAARSPLMSCPCSQMYVSSLAVYV